MTYRFKHFFQVYLRDILFRLEVVPRPNELTNQSMFRMWCESKIFFTIRNKGPACFNGLRHFCQTFFVYQELYTTVLLRGGQLAHDKSFSSIIPHCMWYCCKHSAYYICYMLAGSLALKGTDTILHVFRVLDRTNQIKMGRLFWAFSCPLKVFMYRYRTNTNSKKVNGVRFFLFIRFIRP